MNTTEQTCKNEGCGRPREKGRRICSSCHNKQRSPESIKKNRSKHSEYRREYRRNQKTEVIKRYGGQCYCCGEKNAHFLTIDHVDGLGAEHRKSKTHFRNIFQALATQPVDTKRYRLACFNCNCGRERTGLDICPHQVM